MELLSAARAQMGFSLAFHMVFAALGIGLPMLMLMAEGMWLRTGKAHYKDLARKWGQATGLLFAIGAVSGTALSFELGLLWPRLMEKAGSIIGPAFALEAVAFFFEAIFLGLYLYGWDWLSPKVHWLTGVPVAVSGMLSGVLVVAVNAWMQVPAGFEMDGAGKFINVDPLATFRSPTWPAMAIHSTLSCYIAVGFAVAGVYALGFLRGRRLAYHRSGLGMALAMGTVAALLQPLSGDLNGRQAARHQPIKLAAMEALFETKAGAPLMIGGVPDVKTGKVRFAIEIPNALSLAVAHDAHAVVKGLNDFPKSEWPNVMWVHVSFQVMVLCGVLLIGLGAWYWISRWRGGGEGKWLMRAAVVGSPLGMIALETGWMVSELGRQPWTIYGVMRTSGAVTPSTGVWISFIVFSFVYVALAIVLIKLLLHLAGRKPPAKELGAGKPPEVSHAA